MAAKSEGVSIADPATTPPISTFTSTTHSNNSANFEEVVRRNAVVIAATCASVTGVAAGFPFDSVKTRMQAYRYRSTIECIRTTYASEKLPGFFRGITPVLVSVSFLRTISFSMYNRGKKEVLDVVEGRGWGKMKELVVASSLSGGFAGCVVATLNAPIDFIKVQRQLERLMATQRTSLHVPDAFPTTPAPAAAAGLGENAATPLDKTTPPRSEPLRGTHGSAPTSTAIQPAAHKDLSTWEWAKRIVKLKGWSGLYSGYHMHLLRDLIGTSMYFCGYETCKALFTRDGREAGPFVHMMGGGMAGTLSWIVLYPIDMTKSVLQREALRPNPKYQTATSFVKAKWAKAGIAGFYKGISAQLVRSFPVHALNFLVYEQVMKFCRNFGL